MRDKSAGKAWSRMSQGNVNGMVGIGPIIGAMHRSTGREVLPVIFSMRVAMRGDSYLGNMRTEPGQIYPSMTMMWALEGHIGGQDSL